ncbi:CarboxypepD_reg-like domain-containing protein [Arenibacter palladensis]|uniref:CarboxypepD_reg-like domain-containing protein n=1 Tax=Arenibacter palladensis TaxID=237373 RepID=A0A1M4W2Q7_9FLAO|nr:outer membrane beta-barrel protein [Arenibacter palladensis]MDO6604966.1 outer membrane beta-barrel protein [Arenibacter palladensis]SHE75445.1 CarboxypepD_reg-like domain-containing protein [Arenibacter palladensis]
MKKFHLSILFSILFFGLSFSQDFVLSGKIVDAITQAPLEASTIYAESVKDSALVSYTVSDQKGVFELEGDTSLKEVNVFFSYNGYKPHYIKVKLESQVDLGKVQLEEQAQELEGVLIVGDRVPITIKKDTLEFNADSFKTKPDANVEDVLKKLPGVEVDSDGKITVNGKEVDQVLVNGQVFFSNDPKVATKSLPKDIISKIQISDTKTKEQEFSGEEGEGETKTINLTIKEDKNKGYMGRMAAGYGTDERYQLNGLLNYFSNKKRLSFIASSNNINNSGFSYDEIYDMVGNTNGGYSGAQESGLINNFGNGITTSSNLGTSYANAEKGEYKIDANYFFGYSDSYNDQKTSRENILPDSRYFTENESNFEGSTNSNRGAANIEYDVDETLRVSLQPSMSVNRTNSVNRNNTFSTDEEGDLINSNNRITVNDGFQRNFSNRLSVMKKLDTIGKLITFTFSNDNSENKSTSNLNSVREIFGDDPSVENVDQLSDINNKNNSYELEARYRQPLTTKLFLDIGYEFKNEHRDNTKDVMDYDVDDNRYSQFNEALSSDFNFVNIQQSPFLGLRHNGDKLNLRVNASYVMTELDNQDFLQGTSFSKSYKNLLLRSRLRYSLGKNSRIYLRYDSRLSLPSVSQLQPVPNVNNPLNVVIGNPNLLPSVNHGIDLNYNNYNWKERSGVFFYTGLDIQKDRVSAISTTDENFLRTTRYTNIDGNYSGYGGVGYSKQIKKDSLYTLKFNVRPRLSYGRQVSFTNGVELKAKRFDVTPYVSTTYNYKEVLEIEPGYGISFNNTTYNLDNIEDVEYTSQNANLRVTSYWPKNLIWGNDLQYSYNGNVGPGFRKDALFWNMSLGLQILEDKGTLKVLAYDLLDQNINTRRTTGEDFIQDYQGTVLQQYFMASFTYKFDQFGGKKPDMGSRGRRYYN